MKIGDVVSRKNGPGVGRIKRLHDNSPHPDLCDVFWCVPGGDEDDESTWQLEDTTRLIPAHPGRGRG